MIDWTLRKFEIAMEVHIISTTSTFLEYPPPRQYDIQHNTTHCGNNRKITRSYCTCRLRKKVAYFEVSQLTFTSGMHLFHVKVATELHVHLLSAKMVKSVEL